MRPGRFLILAWAALALGTAAPWSRVAMAAEADPPAVQAKRKAIVGVLVAPPFVAKDAGGDFHGVSITLWRDVARDMGLAWQAVEYDLDGLLAAVESGAVDVGVSALSITPEREAVMDFSQPFYYTGLGIAVAADHGQNLFGKALGRIFSLRVLVYVVSLLGLLLLVGTVVWAIERRRNPGHFRPGHKGIGDGLWWSAVTMTSVGYGDATPRTLAGRAVAMVWMFASVALLAAFTAGITSSMTVETMGGLVRGPEDLHKVRTGVVRDSAAQEELVATHVGVRAFESAAAGLRALVGGEIDAFVHDQPLLHYLAHHAFTGAVKILPGFFDPQLYGFAFPRGSDLRKAVNVAMLRRLEDHEYRLRLLGPYLGKAAVH